MAKSDDTMLGRANLRCSSRSNGGRFGAHVTMNLNFGLEVEGSEIVGKLRSSVKSFRCVKVCYVIGIRCVRSMREFYRIFFLLNQIDTIQMLYFFIGFSSI